jgi:hypothetical protein
MEGLGIATSQRTIWRDASASSSAGSMVCARPQRCDDAGFRAGCRQIIECKVASSALHPNMSSQLLKTLGARNGMLRVMAPPTKRRLAEARRR